MTQKRSLILLLSMTLLAFLSHPAPVHAQSIHEGDTFFDGCILYTVREVRMEKIVWMIGTDDSQITLELDEDNTPDHYSLVPSVQADDPPFQGTSFGAKVLHYRVLGGADCLIFYNKAGEAVYSMARAIGDMDACDDAQMTMKYSANSGPVLSSQIVNIYALSEYNLSELRLMRNEILARHGYKFQSKDLQEYFGKQPWYAPISNNQDVQLNFIERTNIDLIKALEARRKEQ
ncbi:MAG: YARHG domain-containing protein [Bacteroidales bacterium]|nr:YARHG domain-containing protein [Bacteroidales bacterium]